MDECIDHGKRGNERGYAGAYMDKRQTSAHRKAYCVARGLPLAAIDGLVIRHMCDNTRCINPHHLETGTQADNLRDMYDRDRAAVGTRHGNAKLREEDVAWARASYKPYSREFSYRAMARVLGCEHETLELACKGETWKHVE